MPTITVVGSINMDLVVRAGRFPAAGETLLGDTFATIAGGKGANQAVAAQRLGGRVAMVGCVGDDAFGVSMRDGLSDEGIDVSRVDVRAGQPSGVALITVDGTGENTIIVVPGANGTLSGEDVEAAREILASSRVLLLQLEVPLEAVQRAARIAADAGAAVILNAAPAASLPDTLIGLAEYVVVNESEIFALAGDAADRQGAVRTLHDRGARNVVLTLGAAGAILFAADGAVTTEVAFAVDVVDTTAAGDAFVGAFAVALAEGLTAAEALRRGNAAGALAVTREGAQPSLPRREDVDAWLATQR
ncbi:MAG TPA: ribokinase [Luteitalea sp.]|nr:ribokinase [Luteitalea sp.]